jgi:hypothetical protein
VPLCDLMRHFFRFSFRAGVHFLAADRTVESLWCCVTGRFDFVLRSHDEQCAAQHPLGAEHKLDDGADRL